MPDVHTADHTARRLPRRTSVRARALGVAGAGPALVAIGLIVALLTAACSASSTSHDAPSSATYRPAPPLTEITPDGLAHAVTIDNVMAHLHALQRIADEHGGNRAAGTPGYDASLDYVAGLLRTAGFTVTTPEFDYPRFDVDDLSLTADGTPVSADILEYSAGTGQLPVTAKPASVAGHGCAAADFGPSVLDSIAVVTRGGCPFTAKALIAQEAGAVGVVVVNDAPQRLVGATLDSDDPPAIPVVAVSGDLGDTVRTAHTLTMSVHAKTTKVKSRNVIAQTTTGRTDDVVLAGAHLDSVPAGPGINDNGSGTAAVLETALRMGSSPKVPHAVRFAFWGAEEEGLIGSTRYVDSLDDAGRRAIALYLNFDMLASPNTGFFVYDGDDSDHSGTGPGPAGSAGIERVFTRFYATFRPGRPVPVRPTDFDGRSDYGPFIWIGIPAGGVATGAEEKKTAEQARLWGGEAGVAFDPDYHSARDTIDNINRDELAINASAVGYSVATYALSTTGPDGVPAIGQRQRTAR